MTVMPLPSVARPALHWLDDQQEFRALAARAQGLVRLQEDLLRCCRHRGLMAVSLEAGTLRVATPGAALAARLRQTEPSLVSALRSAGWPVERIQFRPLRPEDMAPPAPFEPRQDIPRQALDGLRELHGQAEDPRLKQALERLLKHHARRR